MDAFLSSVWNRNFILNPPHIAYFSILLKMERAIEDSIYILCLVLHLIFHWKPTVPAVFIAAVLNIAPEDLTVVFSCVKSFLLLLCTNHPCMLFQRRKYKYMFGIMSDQWNSNENINIINDFAPPKTKFQVS